MIDEHISTLTITAEEIEDTEKLTRGQTRNNLWLERRKTVLTTSNFGRAAKTKVEPSNKLNQKQYSVLTSPLKLFNMKSK